MYCDSGLFDESGDVMKSLVELICKIGIFMVASQAIVHFAPSQKYAKYMKLVVGIMVLLQFLSPIYKLFGGMEIDWDAQLSNMEKELDESLLIEGKAGAGSLVASVISDIEKEIKSKLNNEAADEGYSVIKVDVSIEGADETKLDFGKANNASYENYGLAMVRVAVRAYADYGKAEGAGDFNSGKDVKIGKISIQKVGIGGDNVDEEETARMKHDEEQEASGILKERFCNVLGIEEKYMEVKVYGAAE